MPDEDNVIDAEIVEESDNLPAVIEKSTHEHTEPMRKWSEEWWAAQSPHTQSRRCRAHSSRTGEPCKNLAMQGGTACRYHGGAAKHVKAAARARLENAAELMAKQLLGIALTAESEAVKLAAIKDSLDRAGLKPPAEVVLSQGEPKPWEELFEGISGGTRAESRKARGVPDAQDNFAGVEGAHLHASSQEGTECQSSRPPTERDPDDQTGPAATPPGREFRDPTTDPRDFDRERQPRPPQRHICGDDAIRLANEANRQIGALKAIESPHKRYRRP
jgi:hypothetical protein